VAYCTTCRIGKTSLKIWAMIPIMYLVNKKQPQSLFATPYPSEALKVQRWENFLFYVSKIWNRDITAKNMKFLLKTDIASSTQVHDRRRLPQTVVDPETLCSVIALRRTCAGRVNTHVRHKRLGLPYTAQLESYYRLWTRVLCTRHKEMEHFLQSSPHLHKPTDTSYDTQR
jgi:hypothetical protein